tara:strand:+ start:2653 stop:2847 length:195 start_codon:yes stop_codon:yes gene_type:complete
MDFVTPKKITSPYSGALSSPKIFERDYGDRILTEAWWYCPTSGLFITKGVVKEVVKDVPTKPRL